MEPDKPEAQPSPGPDFLLVDDAEIHRRVIGRHLVQLGHRYDIATNGKEAVEAVQARRNQYMYVLMDIAMPVMDGMEAARLIRHYEAENDLERCFIVALTACDLPEQRAADCGFHQKLHKPVRMSNLQAALQGMGASPSAAPGQ
jgi:CheY-like chemotaxis protein